VSGGSAAFGAGGLSDINTQVADLRAALSRQSTGNNTLTIADALWTRDIAVNPAFAGDMQRLFKVSETEHTCRAALTKAGKLLCMSTPASCLVSVSVHVPCCDCCAQAKVASVPDAAPINAWAANVTNNLIKEVVQPDYRFNMVS
jgi:methyl coenzyme M reductase beta subunit